METIGAVILHYKKTEKTIACVDSFLRLSPLPFSPHIVVVCNSGRDASDRAITERFKEHPIVEVIQTKKPLVFSRAMNIGVKHLAKYNPRFVILSNNDITFDDQRLYKKIEEEYERSHFGAMGPDVHTVSTDTHSSPFYIRYYLSAIENFKIVLLMYRSLLMREWKKEPKEEFVYNNKKYKERAENVMLQGSFVILSKDYLKRFPLGLYPQKSFFLEEDILLFLCRKFNLKTVYNPEISVDHIHSVSINERFKDKQKKRKFVFRQTLKSRKTFLSLIIWFNLTGKIKFSAEKKKVM